ncbi:MAG: B12-binding domain-containing radical SAM protein, partial [Nitrospirae bacterium]|nr:B12-binding domain-containing radical SAM protein [Nitrospirota bacterium]
MIKIALIKPPPTYSNWYQRPVIGISCISSFLEQNGFNARIFDAAFNKWSEKELIQSIETYKPDIVGITSMTHEITQAAHITSLIKERLGISAIIGGCHLTALPERTMSEFPVFDFGIIGEGEETILELLRSLFNGRKTSDIYSIRGLVFRDNGNIVVNEPRPWMDSKRLNSLPYPAFHYYYGNNSKALADKDSYYVMFSSRGCPYHCAFCMQVLGRKIRSFSPERICQEIEAAVSLFGAHTVNFADEIFLFDNDRTREVLNMMIKRGLNRKIRWSGLTRANMVSPEIISLAKLAGCFHLEMGVESGDNKILKAIGKNITTDEIKRAVAIIKENNIMLGTYYILGHPNETRETLSKTLVLAIALNTDTIAVGIMVPYPGTKIFDIAQRGEGGYRLLSTVWSEYDKYGGRALELKGLPYEELLKF